MHYQPILSMDTGRVVSVEALARWTDPVLGRVGPDEFIAVAERSALIGDLGAYVLNRAVGDVKGLSERYPDLRVAVNVSPVQLRAAAFADHVEVLVARHGLAPQRLVIEVTESLFVSDDGVGLRNLQRLRRRGIEVAIDDFGSGYSSLNYLSRLPASILKVDQVLTRSDRPGPAGALRAACRRRARPVAADAGRRRGHRDPGDARHRARLRSVPGPGLAVQRGACRWTSSPSSSRTSTPGSR